MKGDPEFAKLVQQAIGKKEKRWLDKVDSSKAWQAATWQLERDLDTRAGYAAPHGTSGPNIAVVVNLRDNAKVIDA